MKELLSDANMLVKQDTGVTKQWADEFVKTFTMENRSKFPANRDFLRPHAEKIMTLLDESSRLNNTAADKYEQAVKLSGNEEQRQGRMSFAEY